MEQLCLTNVLNLVIVLFFDPAGSQPLLKISRHFNLRKYFFFPFQFIEGFFCDVARQILRVVSESFMSGTLSLC